MGGVDFLEMRNVCYIFIFTMYTSGVFMLPAIYQAEIRQDSSQTSQSNVK